MSKIDLEKRAEKVRIVLEKRNVRQAPTMRVGVALDISGSARPLYEYGIIQDTVSRLLPVAMRFDDNGEMDMWCFHNDFERLPAASAEDYADYVKREILSNPAVSKWGGTSYAPVMADMLDLYFGRGKSAQRAKGFFGGLFGGKKQVEQPVAASANTVPALALFITDGANDDRSAAAALLRNAQKHPIYWLLVGVGEPHLFGFLKDMADELPNVGFVNLPRLDISDETLYDQVLTEELCTWVAKR